VLTTGVVIFSLKTFFASMLAYLVAINFDLPRPFWAVATIYVVANPLSGTRSFKPESGYEASDDNSRRWCCHGRLVHCSDRIS
jgi:hypothetical protein